jgi:hypothetical protein
MRGVVLLLILSLVETAHTNVVAQEGSGLRRPPEGFTPLFDGKTLTGWRDAEKQAAFWKVEDGVLRYVGKGGRDLATIKNYKNVELWADWKFDEKGGDSGIFFRSRLQVQMWDLKEGSGGLLNNPVGKPGRKPAVAADRKFGEWNTIQIKLAGPNATTTVRLNDKLVVDGCDFLDPKAPPTGPILLEGHRGQVWFRNVFIKELD